MIIDTDYDLDKVTLVEFNPEKLLQFTIAE